MHLARVLLLAFLTLFLAGCGSSSQGDASDGPGTNASATDVSTGRTPVPTTLGGLNRKHKPSAATVDLAPTPSTTPAYRDSKDLCAIYGPAKVAKTYGGGSNPAEIALAYAQASYQPRAQQDAFEGCLAGFK
jgi:hypothetical protein